MSAAQAVFLLLFSLDSPSGPGVPEIITRFDGPQTPALHAEFIRFPANAAVRAEIEWFLDGDGLLAPVGVSPFLYARGLAEDPYRQRGSFSVDLPKVEKPTRFRGVLHARGDDGPSEPLATFVLMLFPEDEFIPRWQRLAEEGFTPHLMGDLGGWRTFFQGQGIAFEELDPDGLAPIPRNSFVLADLTSPVSLFMEQPSKAVLIYGGGGSPMAETFRQQSHADRLLWLGRPPPADVLQDPGAQATFLQMAESFLNPPANQ